MASDPPMVGRRVRPLGGDVVEREGVPGAFLIVARCSVSAASNGGFSVDQLDGVVVRVENNLVAGHLLAAEEFHYRSEGTQGRNAVSRHHAMRARSIGISETHPPVQSIAPACAGSGNSHVPAPGDPRMSCLFRSGWVR
jgi:hypothetical protein